MSDESIQCPHCDANNELEPDDHLTEDRLYTLRCHDCGDRFGFMAKVSFYTAPVPECYGSKKKNDHDLIPDSVLRKLGYENAMKCSRENCGYSIRGKNTFTL